MIRRSAPGGVMAIGMLILFAGIVSGLTVGDPGLTSLGLFLVVPSALYCLLAPEIGYRRVRGKGVHREMTFSADGVEVDQPGMQVRLTWDRLSRITSHKRTYLLWPGRSGVWFIPKRVFVGPAEEAAFLALAGAKAPRTRGTSVGT